MHHQNTGQFPGAELHGHAVKDIEERIRAIFAKNAAPKKSPGDLNKSPFWFLNYQPVDIDFLNKPQQS
jgi:hypothetical protein